MAKIIAALPNLVLLVKTNNQKKRFAFYENFPFYTKEKLNVDLTRKPKLKVIRHESILLNKTCNEEQQFRSKFSNEKIYQKSCKCKITLSNSLTFTLRIFPSKVYFCKSFLNFSEGNIDFTSYTRYYLLPPDYYTVECRIKLI